MKHKTALLMVFPTNEANFDSRYDVLKSDYLTGLGTDKSEVWKSYAASSLVFFKALLETARETGVEVFENDAANLSGLTQATNDYENVILFSHWKGPGVLCEDIDIEAIAKYTNEFQQCLDEFMEYLQNSDSGYNKVILELTNDAKKFSQAFNSMLLNDQIQIVNSLLAFFNLFMNIKDYFINAHMTEYVLDVKAEPMTVRTWNRDVLDKYFSQFIRPGNRLEFCDGLYSKEQIANAVAPIFQGYLDLTHCTSTELSNYLERYSRGAYRIVQFPEPQEPQRACPLLERTLILLAEGRTYRQARNQALADLLQLAREFENSDVKESISLLQKLTNLYRRKL